MGSIFSHSCFLIYEFFLVVVGNPLGPMQVLMWALLADQREHRIYVRIVEVNAKRDAGSRAHTHTPRTHARSHVKLTCCILVLCRQPERPACPSCCDRQCPTCFQTTPPLGPRSVKNRRPSELNLSTQFIMM